MVELKDKELETVNGGGDDYGALAHNMPKIADDEKYIMKLNDTLGDGAPTAPEIEEELRS